MNPDIVDERPAPVPAASDEGRLVLQVLGLQRSGNHAIIDWVCSLFERTVHMNDLPHDFLTDPANRSTEKADCAIYSFEDDGRKLEKTEAGERRLLVDSVRLLDPAALPGTDLRTVYILRDPYNCWASRVKAREGGRLTSPPQLEHFIDNWLAIAERYDRDPDAFVLYNSWFASESYRRAVCARLGGHYSEKTLGEIPLEGRGSSFDGAGRPSLRIMLKRIDYYTTAAFWRRVFKQPKSYIDRLVTPRVDGRKLATDSRFRHLEGREDAKALFENDRVGALSERIFGFRVDGTGKMHGRPGGA